MIDQVLTAYRPGLMAERDRRRRLAARRAPFVMRPGWEALRRSSLALSFKLDAELTAASLRVARKRLEGGEVAR